MARLGLFDQKSAIARRNHAHRHHAQKSAINRHHHKSCNTEKWALESDADRSSVLVF
jgi:hypothetical protein